MAYFANGTEGDILDNQCAKCILGQKPCPIALVQISYNYEQVGNKVAIEILRALVKQDGTCEMYKLINPPDIEKIPDVRKGMDKNPNNKNKL